MLNNLKTSLQEKNFKEININSWIKFYSKKSGIDIIFKENLENFSYIDISDLENPKIFLDLQKIMEKYIFTKEEILFIIFHEIEHIKEEIGLKLSKKGKIIAEQRLIKEKDYGINKDSFSIFESTFRDIFVNNKIINPRNIPVFDSIKTGIYKEKILNQNNFLDYRIMGENSIEKRVKLPKHLQFLYTIIREEMIPTELCIIESEVRNIINKLKKGGIIEKVTNGNFEDRLENLWKYIEPIYKKFLKDDYLKIEQEQEKAEEGEGTEAENEEEKTEAEGGGAEVENNGDQQEQEKAEEGEGTEVENEEEKTEVEGGGAGVENNGDQQEQEKAEEGEGTEVENEEEKTEAEGGGAEVKNNGDQQEQEKAEEGEGTETENEEETEAEEGEIEKEMKIDNNQAGPFNKFYEENRELPHIFKENLKNEELEEDLREILEEIIEKQNNQKEEKTKEDLEMDRRVKNILKNEDSNRDFKEIKEELANYIEYFKNIKQIKDSNTNRNVFDEIINLFTKIKSENLKPRYSSKGPVDIELGVRLDQNSVSEGIGQIKSGNMNPLMFEQDISIEKIKKYIGKFEITIVADGSGSMRGKENIEQKKAIILLLESLKKLNDKIKYSNKDFIKNLQFTTEAIMFDGKGIIKLKDKSSYITDSDRLKLFNGLDYSSGSNTNDYDSIDNILQEFIKKSDTYIKEVKSGKIKKIVFVMTDGNSSNIKLLQSNILKLRSLGILVYGIGITLSGKSVLESYKSKKEELGFGQVCEKSEDLAIILKDLLTLHLEKN